MREIIRNILFLTNIVSLLCLIPFALGGVLTEILGPLKLEKLLEKLHIPLNYDKFWFISIILTVILIVSYFVRIKFFTK